MSHVLSTVVMAAESHEEVNEVLNWAIGAAALAILVGLLVALVAFGGGREHS